MKRLILIAALVAAAASVALAQSPAKPAAGNTEQAIRQIELDWANALAKGDVATIEKFTAADWVLSDPEGNVMMMPQLSAELKAGAMKIESFTLDDLKVRVYGDMALAFGLETEKSSYKGSDSSGQYRFTDVFVKQGGAWKAVATHVSKVVKH